MDAKRLLAVAAGKAAIAISHRLGRGGSAFPGRLARRVDPDLLAKLVREFPHGSVLITGTNGKTTTARMVARMLEAAGLRPAHNRSGANMLNGIATALVGAAPLWPGGGNGRVPGGHDIGVIEVDEATVPRAARELQPRVLLVTNLFRDQLDRYGELRHVASLIAAGLQAVRRSGDGLHGGPEAVAVLNADDPLAADLAGAVSAGTRVLFFGIDDTALGGAAAGHAADGRRCVSCGEPYEYETTFYAHLGHYRCPACGARRPEPHVAVTEASSRGLAGWDLRLSTPRGPVEAFVPAPGRHSIYNALAAAAVGCALGLPPEAIRRGIEAYAAAFGRMEEIPIRGRRVCVALVKNPVACDEMLSILLEEPYPGGMRGLAGAGGDAPDAAAPGRAEDEGAAPGRPDDQPATAERAEDEPAAAAEWVPGRRVLMLLNDRGADGKDVSWIWDVDFERLAARSDEFAFIMASGIRAEEVALRLKYAGFPTARLAVRREVPEALAEAIAATPPGGRLWVLPTYTALLEVREVIHRWGFAPHFWEV